MASQADFELATDIWAATLQNIVEKKPALANFAYNQWQLWNMFFRNALRVKGGDYLEGHIILNSEDNADHVGIWEQDSLVKKNIEDTYTLHWRQAKGGMLWNLMETSINSSNEKIYDVLEAQYESAVKDILEAAFLAICTGPASATDVTSPYGIFSWLPWGTAASTGGWTGYDGHYNDGGAASAATFDRGGIASSSSSNANWASYSADHEGDLDDNLYTLLDRAVRKLNFQAPMYPKQVGNRDGMVKFSMYTNDAVHSALNALNAKSDDNFGYRVDEHYGMPSFRGVPFGYVDIFDTARTSVYGTNPIVGISHDNLYPVIHRDWDFKEIDGKDPNRSVVLQKVMWLRYQIFCKDPGRAGFVVTQIPT